MIELTDKILKRFEIQLKKIYVGNAGLKKRRPELDQIHYSKDGHVEITNSHVGVRLSDVHDKGDSDENYPDMNKLFQISDDAETVRINKEEAKLLEHHLNVLYRNKIEALRVSINNEGIYIEANEKNDVYHKSGIQKNLNVSEEITFGIDSRYLHDALQMFRLMKLEEITIHVVPNKRIPISLTSKNLQYLILPVILNK